MWNGLVNPLRELGLGFLHVLWPKLCPACGAALEETEPWLCWHCSLSMPEINSHRDTESAVARQFWGRINLEEVCVRWKLAGPGQVRQLIHEMKYSGQKQLAELAGEAYGQILAGDGALGDADFLVPVPMTFRKQKRRGYNQAEAIAIGIGKVLGKPVRTDLLRRKEGGQTQTQKDRFERWKGLSSLYSAGAALDEVPGGHAVLVDDVVTTGSTVEVCAGILRGAALRVSLVALASAQ